MKKLTSFSALILGSLFMTANLAAQAVQSPVKETTTQTTQAGEKQGVKFIDENGDGICDHYQSRANQGKCANFVDENGDGRCDHCKGMGKKGPGPCCGKEYKNANCKGMNAGCCGKGKGHHHRHGQKGDQKTDPGQPRN